MSIRNLLHNLGVAGGGLHARHAHGGLMPLPNPNGLQAGPAFMNPRAQRGQAMGQGVAWGGQNFQDPQSLVAWINAHGGHTNVAQFEHNHPGAFPQQHAHQVGGPYQADYTMGSASPQFMGPPIQGGMQGALAALQHGGGGHFLPPPVHPPLLAALVGHRRPRRLRATNAGFLPPPAP